MRHAQQLVTTPLRPLRWPLLATLSLLLLGGCAGPSGGGGSAGGDADPGGVVIDEPPSVPVCEAVTGDVDGVPAPFSRAIHQAANPLNEQLAFAPGEVIVTFGQQPADLQTNTLPLAPMVVETAGISVQYTRSLGLPATHLYRFDPNEASTLDLIEEILQWPGVVAAEPNWWVYTLAGTVQPNDALFGDQWHFDAIRLPAAWALTSGSDAVVVAVVDSGILFSPSDAAASHPDFDPARMLPGYDFITSTQVSEDGDGRDPNPYDPGFGPGYGYHGTHVAGTIGAWTNNGTGVAGVDWSALLLPVRALGPSGAGSLVDVVESILWAAGLYDTGVPMNVNPADVINLSLGGSGSCPSLMQSALTAVKDAGVVVVAAAGNGMSSNDQVLPLNASSTFPANCDDVLTVGATGKNGARAFYSNYGEAIDVMAPGGSTNAGVLSLSRDSGGFTYAEQIGTSMATPHVAGLVALMKSLDPTLNLDDVRALLAATADPLTAEQCGGTNCQMSGDNCGAGIVDAYAVLNLLLGP